VIPFPRAALSARLRSLAEEGAYLGTSSWKYPGWLGMIYDRERYEVRGRFAESRFRKHCLAEYAETFPAVCVDAGYYQFPQPKSVEAMMAQVPPHFRFGFKVTDAITVLDFPRIERYGPRAGTRNPQFLDAALFEDRFLGPLESHRSKVGVLIFEFGHFQPGQFERGAAFVGQLEQFLGRLPRRWPYGVEIRNRSFLRAEYFDALRAHNIAHVFNNWTRMPSIAQQLDLTGSLTADFTAARFLLTPGRSYAKAVESFEPYSEIAALDTDAREAARRLVETATAPRPVRRPSLIFVNNRLEGSSPRTIAAVVGSDG